MQHKMSSCFNYLYCNEILKIYFNRCFGLLVSPGRNVKHGDMHLIEMVNIALITFLHNILWECVPSGKALHCSLHICQGQVK